MITMNDTPALRALSRYAQWVIWKKEKGTKVPYNPSNGKKASSTDPLKWGDIDEAMEGLKRYKADGIGFVLTKDDPFVFIDLDHVLENGRIKTDWAKELVEAIDSYTEISPSGDGLHIIASGRMPDGIKHKTKYNDGSMLEVYDSGRYMTFTGDVWNGKDDIKERDLSVLMEFAEHKATPKEISTPESDPVDVSDEWIIEKLKQKGQWPSEPTVADDWSSLDMSFANRLAFWCGKDIERMDRIFRQSPLMRKKWDRPTAGSTYGRLTLQKAIDFVQDVYDPDKGNACPFGPLQEDGFEADEHIDDEPKDTLWLYKKLKKHGLEVWFDIGIEKYGIKSNGVVTYVAKTSLQQIIYERLGKVPKNLAVPTYKGVYDPTKPEHWEENGEKLINLFRPSPLMEAAPQKEMPEAIKTLLLSLFDYDVKLMDHFLNWLAYIYQYKQRTGVAWIFMGKQGTGKGLIVEVLKRIFEEHMSSNITDATLESQFNPYLHNKLLVHLNEVSADNRKSRMLVKNRLKTWITDETLYINRKNTKEIEVKNYCNFIINSNESIPVDIEDGDRRFNVVECNNVLKEMEWWTSKSYQETLEAAGEFANFLAGYEVRLEDVNKAIESEKKRSIVEATENINKQIATALKEKDLDWFLDNGLEILVDKKMVNDFEWKEIKESLEKGIIPNRYLSLIIFAILGVEKSLTWIKRNIVTLYDVGESKLIKNAGKVERAVMVL